MHAVFTPDGGGTTEPDDPAAQDPDAITIKNGEEAAGTLDMKTGDTVTLTAIATKDGSADNVKQAVTWSSDNETVATVSNGKVTAKGAGSATITATSSSATTVTATVTVTVTAKPKIHNFDKNVTITAEGVDITKDNSGSETSKSYMDGALALTATGSGDKLSSAVGTSSGHTLSYKGVEMTRGFKPNKEGRALTFTAPEKGSVSFVLYNTNDTADGTIDVDGTLTKISNGPVPGLLTKALEKGSSTTLQLGSGTASPMIFLVIWTPDGVNTHSHTLQASGTKISEATCTEGAKTIKWCTNVACGYSETETEGTGTGHDYQDGVCSKCKDIDLSHFKGLLDAADAKPDAVAQADVIDEDTLASAAKTWAEGVVDNTNITVAVTKTSYTPAVEGDATNTNGTDGSYKFTVTLTTKADATGVTSAEKELVVTATAHGAEVKKDALNTAITAAEAAAAAITVDTDAANVDEGKKWITQADLDTYTAAIAAAKTVAAKEDATQAEVNTAVSTLADATTAFEAAQQVGTKADPYTFDAAKLTGAADKTAITKNEMKAPFGIAGTVMKRGSASAITSIETDKPGKDDSSPNAFTVTVPEGKVCDLMIKASSNGGSNTSDFVLKLNGTGDNIANTEGKTSVSGASDAAVELHWTGLEAGTYYFFTPAAATNKNRGVRIITAHVNFEEAAGPVDPTVTVTSVKLDKTTASLKVGESVTLKATVTVTPDVDDNKAVTWSSDKEDIAAVAADGIVTAKAAGTATITAASVKDNTKAATCTVTVTAGGGEKPIDPPTPEETDVTNLNDAIASATDALNSVETAAKAEDVEAGALWVTAADRAALEDAITAAQNVVKKTDVTQAEVDDAVKTLNVALDAFVDSAKEGTKTGSGSDEPITTEYVLDATKLANTPVDSSDITKGPLDPKELSVPFSYNGEGPVIKRFQKSDGATYALDTKGPGKGSIDIIIPEGATAKIVAEVSSTGSSNTSDFVLQKGTEKIVNNEGKESVTGSTAEKITVTWNSLAAGTYSLMVPEASNNNRGVRIHKITVAITTAGGNVPVVDVADKTALKKAVADAEAAIAAATISTDGSDVSTSEKWVSQADVDALNAALKSVSLVVKNAKADQTKVDAATAKVNTAIEAFKAAEKDGTKSSGSSSGGGGGGGSSVPSSTGGTTVTNPDGSKTNTKTNKTTGTVTETTTWPNGDKTVVTTTKDGTKTEVATKKNGSKTETVTKPDGSSSVAVTETNGVKTETAVTTSGETSAKVTLPKHIDKTIVTIPVKNAAEGTVAVIVAADGTEKVIKTSLISDKGVELLVTGNVSVKIKDNAKTFQDIENGYWAKGAVDFVSSREIFKGTTAVTFSPLDVVDRGMMATVLYRLGDARAEGENAFFDVPADAWYTDAVVWANRSGVVTGYADGTFGPADAVTREQMATMLFRYAKVMKMDVTAKGDMSKFSDANEVSSWAGEAMAWAVGVGLINGVGDPMQGVTLSPAKTASRAEVAAIMQRMVKLMMQ